MNTEDLIKLDLNHVWHPCAQMKDYESLPPLLVDSAEGSLITASDGRKIIDAISSWWCKNLGHSHPEIRKAVNAQLDRFEHIIMANTCNETLALLSAELSKLAGGLDRVFYADNGTTGVEVALKMSLQYHAQTGNPQKKYFASLTNGYHGEGILALSVGDCDIYSSPFAHLLPKTFKLGPLSYVSGKDDKNWDKYPEESWNNIEKVLDSAKNEIAAIIFEPILQGAGQMRIYSPALLKKLRKWADAHNVFLVADEVMTAFGRTGKALACEHAGIVPDIAVLSKGLTAGWGPMSAVLTSTKVYNAFYDDYASGRAFMHSNTYAGYAVSAAAALEAINVYKSENIFETVEKRSPYLLSLMKHVADESGCLTKLRGIGFVAAADIIDPASGKPFPASIRTGFEFYKNAVNLGALLRPIGDTIYFLPPFNTSDTLLEQMAEIAIISLKKAISGNGGAK